MARLTAPMLPHTRLSMCFIGDSTIYALLRLTGTSRMAPMKGTESAGEGTTRAA